MQKKPLLLLAVIIAVGLGIFVGIKFFGPHNFHGTVLQSPEAAKDFSLTSMHGQSVKLSDFRGKIVLLYFGYTFCPDVCPTTLSEIKKAMGIMGNGAEHIQVIMITVDPERDTPAVLNSYMAQFDPSFLGLTGSVREIQNIASPFGVYFARQENTNSKDYLMEHTAALMAINQQGYLKLIWPYGTPAADLADDLNYMLR